jgi:hypothetical protein
MESGLQVLEAQEVQVLQAQHLSQVGVVEEVAMQLSEQQLQMAMMEVQVQRHRQHRLLMEQEGQLAQDRTEETEQVFRQMMQWAEEEVEAELVLYIQEEFLQQVQVETEEFMVRAVEEGEAVMGLGKQIMPEEAELAKQELPS